MKTSPFFQDQYASDHVCPGLHAAYWSTLKNRIDEDDQIELQTLSCHSTHKEIQILSQHLQQNCAYMYEFTDTRLHTPVTLMQTLCRTIVLTVFNSHATCLRNANHQKLMFYHKFDSSKNMSHSIAQVCISRTCISQ